jgi:predicted ATPase
LDLLSRRWAQAKAGNGRAVLISAEPGVGKSRLAEVLAERIATDQHTQLRYFCSPHHQNSALYPVIAQMGERRGFRPGTRRRTGSPNCKRCWLPPSRRGMTWR